MDNRYERWNELKDDYLTLDYHNFATKYTPDLFIFSLFIYCFILLLRLMFSKFGIFMMVMTAIILNCVDH